MSTTLAVAEKFVTIYFEIPVFLAGILGGLLNTIVFLSLRTFRQSSCAFYLTLISILNIGQLFTGLLSRILIALFGIAGSETSIFYCEFRPYSFRVCVVTRARTSTSTASKSIVLVLKNMYLVLVLLLGDGYLVLVLVLSEKYLVLILVLGDRYLILIFKV